jgi:hypothetical protein
MSAAIKNTMVPMIPKSPSSQGNQRVEALQNKVFHSFRNLLPPAHKEDMRLGCGSKF